jgi:hypothetical protein
VASFHNSQPSSGANVRLTKLSTTLNHDHQSLLSGGRVQGLKYGHGGVICRGLVEDEPLLVHISQTHGYAAYYLDLQKIVEAARMAELQGVLKRRYGVEGAPLSPPQPSNTRKQFIRSMSLR